jgi:hypothetical protein
MLKMLDAVPYSTQEEEASLQKISQVINHNLENTVNITSAPVCLKE